jgi:hypothetical protein
MEDFRLYCFVVLAFDMTKLILLPNPIPDHPAQIRSQTPHTEKATAICTLLWF